MPLPFLNLELSDVSQVGVSVGPFFPRSANALILEVKLS
jgi:hypothetical protein